MPEDGDMMLCVNIYYPENLKLFTSDLPLAFSKATARNQPTDISEIDLRHSQMEQLMAHHVDLTTRSKEKVWYSYRLLTFFCQ